MAINYNGTEKNLLYKYRITFNIEDRISVDEVFYNCASQLYMFCVVGLNNGGKARWINELRNLIASYNFNDDNIFISDDNKFIYGMCTKDEYRNRILDYLLIESERYTNKTIDGLCCDFNLYVRNKFKQVGMMSMVYNTDKIIEMHELKEEDIIEYIKSHDKFNNLFDDDKLSFYSIKKI